MIFRTVTAAAVLASAPARACPTVRLIGEPELVADVARVLSARGIAVDRSDCPSVTARVERSDDGIRISIDRAQPIDREVREIETAATVIESFARDVAAPLLATRTVPSEPVQPIAPVTIATTPVRRRPHGLHSSAGVESSVASDHSRWVGIHAGGCWMIGVVCLAARARSSRLVDNAPGEMRRNSWEIQLGLDAPFALGSWMITPGMAAGPSGMSTWTPSSGETTNGLRADAHATLSIPLTHRFAVDVHVALDLLQQIHIDERMENTVPEEPWGFARVGLGLRYGAR